MMLSSTAGNWKCGVEGGLSSVAFKPNYVKDRLLAGMLKGHLINKPGNFRH
jgi:hypothetical protein